MLRTHDHGLDLRLMRILQLLLAECSVSRTADLLGQSQPAVSAALKRLRDIFGDPLLVRSGSKLVPTDRGLEAGARAARLLAEIDGMIGPGERFDPLVDARLVQIFAANCLGTFFIPRIAERMRRDAPAMRAAFCATTASEREIFEDLEAGKTDLVIGNWPLPRENLRFAPLLDTDMVLAVRHTHPLAGKTALTLAEYLAAAHLSPTPHSGAAVSPVDGRLAQLDVQRYIAVTVPEFALVPAVLARTDLVFTSSRPYAEQMAAQGAVALIEAPPELGPMRFYMLWHERMHHSPCNKWLRKLIRSVAGDTDGLATQVSQNTKRTDIFVC